MGGDEILDDIGQIVFLCQLETLGHVADNHLGTIHEGHALVGIDARLILGVIDGILNLSDVVVIGARAYQLTLGTDLIGDLRSQVAHLNRVLEGAGGHLAHPSEHFLVHIRELDQRDIGGEAESLLDEIEQRVGAEEEDAVDQQVVVFAVVDLRDTVVLYPAEGEVGQRCGDGD